MIRIEAMSQENLDEIFFFEQKHRAYFESILPSRPLGYFDRQVFSRLMEGFLEEQARGECYLCILRDTDNQMVGRVNFSSISKENKEVVASLGYRIDPDQQGKGYASLAVKKLIDIGVSKFGITRIEAGTANDNIGSQKVLLKNGFTLIGLEKKVMRINEKWIDGLLFEKQIAHVKE